MYWKTFCETCINLTGPPKNHVVDKLEDHVGNEEKQIIGFLVIYCQI